MRVTQKGMKVLMVFLSEPIEGFSGSDLHKLTGVGFGTIYPMLSRFEKAGWLRGEWEEIDPTREGRPAKRLYKLTGLGQNEANRLLREVVELGGLAWAH